MRHKDICADRPYPLYNRRRWADWLQIESFRKSLALLRSCGRGAASPIECGCETPIIPPLLSRVQTSKGKTAIQWVYILGEELATSRIRLNMR